MDCQKAEESFSNSWYGTPSGNWAVPSAVQPPLKKGRPMTWKRGSVWSILLAEHHLVATYAETQPHPNAVVCFDLTDGQPVWEHAVESPWCMRWREWVLASPEGTGTQQGLAIHIDSVLVSTLPVDQTATDFKFLGPSSRGEVLMHGTGFWPGCAWWLAAEGQLINVGESNISVLGCSQVQIAGDKVILFSKPEKKITVRAIDSHEVVACETSPLNPNGSRPLMAMMPDLLLFHQGSELGVTLYRLEGLSKVWSRTMPSQEVRCLVPHLNRCVMLEPRDWDVPLPLLDLVGVDLSNGNEVWRADLGLIGRSWPFSRAVVAGDQLWHLRAVATSTPREASEVQLVCRDVATGEELHVQPVKRGKIPMLHGGFPQILGAGPNTIYLREGQRKIIPWHGRE